VRQVRVQGCLPTLLVLLLLVGLGALAVTFGLALAAVTLGLVLLAWVVRFARALLGGAGGPGGPGPGGPGPSRPASGHVESLPPGWAATEAGGPVVEAGSPDAGAAGAGEAEDRAPPTGDGERNGPPRG
jgi:hypothetical protein